MKSHDTEAVIVGAGPAGLAVAACLKRAAVDFELLERGQTVGSVWHAHYDRLHLHTDKARSELPYFHFPKSCPRYPSRSQVIEYLEAYSRHLGLRPRFGQNVISARVRDRRWHAQTAETLYDSKYLIIATGFNGRPYIPTWPGKRSFGGELLHSSKYRNGQPYSGKDVLVVGFGNSGGEIAIDLWEHGARPTLAVRSPVNIIPRDLLGIPMLAIAIPMSRLPGRLADALTAPIVRLIIGDHAQLGLRKLRYGPFTQVEQTARIPVIDVGTVDLIKNGHVEVRPGIERFTKRGVVFADGREGAFDAVILATGFRPGIDSFLEDASVVVDDEGCPRRSGREAEIPGLYFCGFYVSATGMFREVAIEAGKIARDILRKSSSAASGQPDR